MICKVVERKGAQDARMLEFRWLLEELRVSFFAQELRTPQPVSIKRLGKAWVEQSLYQTAKIWQPCRTRNTSPAEKHHTAFLVCLQESVRDVGAVGNKLH